MRPASLIRVAALLLLLLPLGSCQQSSFDLDAETLAAYRTRVAEASSRAAAVESVGRRPTSQPAAGAASRPQGDSSLSLGERQPKRIVRMSLQDTLHRALANSLDIKVESYSPGMSAADVVVAEAAFDAVLFSDFKYSKLDNPVNSTSPYAGTGEVDDRTLDAGIKKRLSTGGQISAKYSFDRNRVEVPFTKFNPSYTNNATLELTQPLLQNFGTDVNRAQILINKNKRDISLFTFRRQVIDTLSKVEQAYWNLYFARQSLAIQRALLAQTEETRDFVKARLEFDALQVQLSQASSAVASRRANVIRLASDVKDAEDQLKNLVNDPTLPIGEDIAIIPTDDPSTQIVKLDPEQELWAGLENRSELQEARLNISSANIARGVAKNQLLPELDLFLQWNVIGLQTTFPRANEELADGNFQDYVVGLTFQFPIGNRAATAQVRKSQLQLEQAVASYHNAASQVMTQIQTALRNVRTSYDEILANNEATQAAADNLTALVERRERLSPEYLNVQLTAQETLANARRALQSAIATYNIAIVQLEQAKGTLLRYDRVELAPESAAQK